MPIRREADRPHTSGVPGEGPLLLAANQVPQFYGVVVTARESPKSIRREADASHTQSVPGEGPLFDSTYQIPESHRGIVATGIIAAHRILTAA